MIIACLAALLFPHMINAQYVQNKIHVSDLNITRNGGQIAVTFSASIAKKAVKSDYSLAFVPVITDGIYKVSLTPVIIKSKTAKTLDWRHEWVTGVNSSKYSIIYAKNGTAVDYNSSVSFQPWMENASLNMESLIWGCCNSDSITELMTENILPSPKKEEPKLTVKAETNMPPSPATIGDTLTRAFSFIIYKSEWKHGTPIYDEDRGNALTIYYRVGRSDIEAGYKSNRQTLTNLISAIEVITNSENAEVAHITVAGFASPEGSFGFNDKLAWERAVSVKEYILKHTKIADSVVSVYNGSEDWRGLRAMVAASDLPDKQKIIGIIDTVPIEEKHSARLEELKKINEGTTYRYLYDHFFPELRNGAFIKVYYENK